jgi:hypothetical protein
VPDPRAIHFWTESTSLGDAFRPVLGLTEEPAWDVYLVYPAGVVWEGDLPAPAGYLHQLRGRLPEERLLSGLALVDLLRSAAGK